MTPHGGKKRSHMAKKKKLPHGRTSVRGGTPGPVPGEEHNMRGRETTVKTNVARDSGKMPETIRFCIERSQAMAKNETTAVNTTENTEKKKVPFLASWKQKSALAFIYHNRINADGESILTEDDEKLISGWIFDEDGNMDLRAARVPRVVASAIIHKFKELAAANVANAENDAALATA